MIWRSFWAKRWLIAAMALAGCPGTAAATTLSQAGSVVTVLGPVDPARLGPTLMHEHLFIDWFEGLPAAWGTATISPSVRRRMQQAGWPIPEGRAQALLFNSRTLGLESIDALRRDQRMRTNYVIDDERLVRDEVAAFAAAGGRTIVDMTPYGLGRDSARLRRLARASGLQVVMGTGWYRWPFHPAEIARMSVDQLADHMIRDVRLGDMNGVRAGIIGEIPVDSRSVRLAPGEVASTATIRARSAERRNRLLSRPAASRDEMDPAQIYDQAEIKVLRAAARASRATGAALSIHGVDPWIGYLDIAVREGADPARIIIGHAHYIFEDPELLRLALARGVVLEADYALQYYASQSPVGDVNGIVAGIAWAVAHGYQDQILLSLDICNKVGLLRYGGGGYATLYNHIFPRLRAAGVSDEAIHHIMVDNPRRLLTLVEPRK